MALQKLYRDAEPDHGGHVECLVAKYPNKFRWTETHGWLWNNGKFWQLEMAHGKVIEAVHYILRKRQSIGRKHKNKKLENKSTLDRWTVTGVTGTLQDWPGIYTDISEFDENPYILNCQNGVIDLRSGMLTPHFPNDMFTYCIPIEYDQNAQSDEWLNFLGSLGHSNDISNFLQCSLGYSLTGIIKEEMLVYFFGKTRSGKGVITETLLKIMGELGQGVNFRMFTADRTGDTQNFDLAPLRSKRLIVAGEPNRREGVNEATIKAITGGDMIYCSFKHKSHFSYRPQFKIILSSNHHIAADPADDAVWGRIRLVPFNKSFLGKEDKTLKERLQEKDNLQGILTWLVQGATEWYKNGLPYPDKMKLEIGKHRESSSTVIVFFKDQCDLKDKTAVITVTNLYNYYKAYCNDEGYRPLGRKRFKNEVETVYQIYEKRGVHRGKTQRVFNGVQYVP